MSKERLERIKERVNFHGHLDDDVEWLIEQAKRVQALEFYKQDWKLVTGQNKRYRGTVEEAIKDLENECLWDALIKLKALEGEE